MLSEGAAPYAVELWGRAFPALKVDEPEPMTEVWHLKLGGQSFTLFDSPMRHDFAPTPSWSFMVDLDTAEDVDAIAKILSDGGEVMMPPYIYDFGERFAWVADPFKISWQLRYEAKP
ncbi:MAG: VOC family protein [Pseudomonadota bacterium]